MLYILCEMWHLTYTMIYKRDTMHLSSTSPNWRPRADVEKMGTLWGLLIVMNESPCGGGKWVFSSMTAQIMGSRGELIEVHTVADNLAEVNRTLIGFRTHFSVNWIEDADEWCWSYIIINFAGLLVHAWWLVYDNLLRVWDKQKRLTIDSRLH